MISEVAIVVLAVASQFALIGQAVAAQSQAACQGAWRTSIDNVAGRGNVYCFPAASPSTNSSPTCSPAKAVLATRHGEPCLTISLSLNARHEPGKAEGSF